MFLLRIAPEGFPYLTVALILTFAVYFIGKPWMALFPLVLFLYMLLFFRDPDRIIPEDRDTFVSPADGKIILIKDTIEEVYTGEKVKQISIFMSIFDVHVNRSPCDGRVDKIKHTPGGFRAAYTNEAELSNENIAMLLNTGYGKILVRQVAGLIARRAVCRVSPGDSLKKGQRYGIIKFGSRVDIYLPENVRVKVVLGQKVKAGETVLAAIDSAPV
ncbi:MAG: phosphatidylserine decarboxylase family protein [Candidatus Mariimomonas ferrooxydans]